MQLQKTGATILICKCRRCAKCFSLLVYFLVSNVWSSRNAEVHCCTVSLTRLCACVCCSLWERYSRVFARKSPQMLLGTILGKPYICALQKNYFSAIPQQFHLSLAYKKLDSSTIYYIDCLTLIYYDVTRAHPKCFLLLFY